MVQKRYNTIVFSSSIIFLTKTQPNRLFYAMKNGGAFLLNEKRGHKVPQMKGNFILRTLIQLFEIHEYSTQNNTLK